MKPFRLTPQYPTERQEQIGLVKWARLRAIKQPALNMLISIPNGGYALDSATGAKLKAEGLAKGFPDLLLLYPSGQYHALAIEMKSQRKGAALRPEQRQWIERLQAAGYAVCVCYGANAAIQTIERYLNLNGVERT